VTLVPIAHLICAKNAAIRASSAIGSYVVLVSPCCKLSLYQKQKENKLITFIMTFSGNRPEEAERPLCELCQMYVA